MSKHWLVLLIFLSSFLLVGCLATDENVADPSLSQASVAISSAQPTSTPSPVPVEFTARFEIYTNGTKRVFTDAKYHRQSADIYIENPDPHLIHIKKPNLTWSDFFSTLPFSLQKECLVTGTKQTFCNTETKKLHFLLNGQEEPGVLDKVIMPNDLLRVEYR